MGDLLKQLYGSYEVPKEIKDLIKLEKELQKDNLSLEMIGFRPIVEPYNYSITPFDVIPFADTGGDGVHFGFLTEFGQIKDLLEAPIVCISPTNDPPIRYIARNFKEFLDLANSVPYVELLESFWAYETEEQLQLDIDELMEETEAAWEQKRKKVSEQLKLTFNAKEREVLPYIKEVRNERKQKVLMETIDGLGVLGEASERIHKNFQFQYPLSENELNRMKDYLNKADIYEKLAFLRDANFNYVVSPSFDKEIFYLLKEILKDLQLVDELERLKIRE